MEMQKTDQKYRDYDAVFNQSSNVAGFMAFVVT